MLSKLTFKSNLDIELHPNGGENSTDYRLQLAQLIARTDCQHYEIKINDKSEICDCEMERERDIPKPNVKPEIGVFELQREITLSLICH